jgi:hypothetical protein
MFGLRGGIAPALALAASLAVLAAPSVAAARSAPSFYDNGVGIQDAYSAEVAEAVHASGFAGPAPSSSSLPALGLGDTALGVFFGAGLMLLLLGPAGVFRGSRRGTERPWRTPPSADRSAVASSPALSAQR